MYLDRFKMLETTVSLKHYYTLFSVLREYKEQKVRIGNNCY